MSRHCGNVHENLPVQMVISLPATPRAPRPLAAQVIKGSAMTEPEHFPHLFAPARLRGHTLRCRIVFGAHTANMAEGGLPAERHFGYYRERARGGAGMIVVEPTRRIRRRSSRAAISRPTTR